MVTALLTAFYMTRQVFLVFFGKARWDEARADLTNVAGPEGGTVPIAVPAPEQLVAQAVGAAVHELSPNEHDEASHPPHESPWLMTVPLIVLLDRRRSSAAC